MTCCLKDQNNLGVEVSWELHGLNNKKQRSPRKMHLTYISKTPPACLSKAANLLTQRLQPLTRPTWSDKSTSMKSTTHPCWVEDLSKVTPILLFKWFLALRPLEIKIYKPNRHRHRWTSCKLLAILVWKKHIVWRLFSHLQWTPTSPWWSFL